MTSDKQKNHLLQQSGTDCKKSYSSFKKSKTINKKTTLKQQKQKALNKCPLASQTKQKSKMPKISSSSSLDDRQNKNLISETESLQNDMSSSINESRQSNQLSSSSSSSQQQSSSLSSKEKNTNSGSSFISNNFTQIKQEEIDITDHNSCPFSASPNQSPSNDNDQLFIRNRINHEPMLFLHNKWDILPNKDYNIFGDILIETDFVSDKKFSSQNHWKPPLNVEIIPNKMVAKMNIGSYGTTMRDFSIISNFMKMCNHDEIQSYSFHLDKWQSICNKLVLQKQRSSMLRNNASTSSEQEDEETVYAARLKQFEAQCDSTIQALNSEGKIFSYSKKRYNIHTQNLEEYEYGFNQYLLAIMGCESEHLSTIIMRQGRPNFFDTKSRLKMSQQLVMNYLNINKSTTEQIAASPEYLQKVSIITFDDLQVPSSAFSYCMNFKNCKMEFSSTVNDNLNSSSCSSTFSQQQSQINNYNNTDYDFVLQIVELDIEAQHISTLLNIREFNDHEQKLNDLKENIQYEFDIHVLLQKYYKPVNSTQPNTFSAFTVQQPQY